MLEFTTKISPSECAKILRQHSYTGQNLVHEEYHELCDGKQICTMVFDRYYLRTSSRASLTVILENFYGSNRVRCISAGSSEGMFKFDWGAGKNFSKWAETILEPYIVKG